MTFPRRNATPKRFSSEEIFFLFKKIIEMGFSWEIVTPNKCTLEKSQTEKKFTQKSDTPIEVYLRKVFYLDMNLAPKLLQNVSSGTSHFFSLNNATPKNFLWEKVNPKKITFEKKMLRPNATPKISLGNKSLFFFEKCYSKKISLEKSYTEKIAFEKQNASQTKNFAPNVVFLEKCYSE